MTDEQTPTTDTDAPAGIVVSLTVYGIEDATFFVALTPQGDGALFDAEGWSSIESLAFSHELGSTVAGLMRAAEAVGIDSTTLDADKRIWFDFRSEEAFARIPADLVDVSTLDDSLSTLFWEELNDQLDDDAVLADGDLDDEPYGFENGDQETFDRAIMLAQACWFRLNPRDEFITEISTGEDEASDDETPKGLQDLIEAIACAFGPTGGTYEYNDGDGGRKSGYSYCSGSHRFETADSREHFSARELIEAPRALIALLAPFNVDPRVHAPCLFGETQEACAA